ncbi:MAG: sensor histidine kinase [Spirochaetaceae bacterium]|nr:MAG: sensor histidine kinase [Spirochaetaceae bacterium]
MKAVAAGTRRRRIQTTIALAFGAIVLGTAILMGILSYSFTEEAVQRTSRDYTEQLVTQVQTNIDSYITHMQNIAEVVQLNEQVQAYLSGSVDDLSPQQRAQVRARITSFLNTISRTRDDISLILIVGNGGEVLTHDEAIALNPAASITDQRWYRAARAQSGRPAVSPSHVQNIVAGEFRWVITLSRTINNPDTGVEYGVMLVDLNFSVINELVSRIGLGKRGYLFIVDPEGRIVYHPRQELIYSNLEREHIDLVLQHAGGSFEVGDTRGVRIYSVSVSPNTGWRIVGVNYAAEMVRNRDTIARYYVFGTLLCVVLALVMSVIVSHRLSRPILRLRSSMQAVERGDFDIAVDVSSQNEIGDLARDFTIMVAQIKELMRRNADEQEQKRKSELMALQNQITPHFLYNTLDSVIWMAEGKQHANVVKTISALARMLRLSVSRGSELISIQDEIDHARNYLTIQKIRYRDKLDFSIEVDGEIMRLRTPKVILQPLVENAIYHGIKNKESGGRVTVTGSLHDGEVLLRVQDDGVGMSAERHDEVPVSAVGVLTRIAAPPRRGRVGLRNVHERIQLYFGPKYGLSFESEQGAGTSVTVRLPVVEANGDDDER